MGRQRIYVNAHGASRVHASGFSWFAAVMPPLWAIRHRLYRTALAAFAAGLAINEVALPLNTSGASPFVTVAWGVWTLVVGGVTGGVAARWHAFVLRRAGYVVAAEEPE